jgi:hypothetical protein
MKKVLGLLAAGMAALATANAQGTMEAMQGYTGTTSGSMSPIYSVQPGPVGWTFQPTANISVSALGAWAYAMPGTGLEIGLWNASGSLLASNTVNSHSQAVNQSLYAAITPVLLTAGQTYYLAAFSPAGSFQCVAVAPNSPPNGFATMNSDITLGNVAWATNSGFAFPSLTQNAPGSAIIAPNFEFQPVPEPSALPAAAAAILSLVLWRRRTGSSSSSIASGFRFFRH